jgi:hypothetical protein
MTGFDHDTVVYLSRSDEDPWNVVDPEYSEPLRLRLFIWFVGRLLTVLTWSVMMVERQEALEAKQVG